MKLSCVRSTRNRRNRSNTGRGTLLLTGAVSLMLLISGCGDRSSDILDEDTYIDLLVEIHILRAIDNRFEDHQKTMSIQESVLDHYGVSIEQFDRSHQHYMQDTEAQRDRISKARTRLNEELADLNSRLMELESEEEEEEEEVVKEQEKEGEI